MEEEEAEEIEEVEIYNKIMHVCVVLVSLDTSTKTQEWRRKKHKKLRYTKACTCVLCWVVCPRVRQIVTWSCDVDTLYCSPSIALRHASSCFLSFRISASWYRAALNLDVRGRMFVLLFYTWGQWANISMFLVILGP